MTSLFRPLAIQGAVDASFVVLGTDNIMSCPCSCTKWNCSLNFHTDEVIEYPLASMASSLPEPVTSSARFFRWSNLISLWAFFHDSFYSGHNICLCVINRCQRSPWTCPTRTHDYGVPIRTFSTEAALHLWWVITGGLKGTGNKRTWILNVNVITAAPSTQLRPAY